MSELRKDTVGELFMNLMQHLKCIEVRLEYAKAITSQKQKYAINGALTKVKSAVDQVCDLLGDSSQVMSVKKELDKVDMVYVMTLTEQLFSLSTEDLEEVTDLIDNHLMNKYATEQQQVSGIG